MIGDLRPSCGTIWEEEFEEMEQPADGHCPIGGCTRGTLRRRRAEICTPLRHCRRIGRGTAQTTASGKRAGHGRKGTTHHRGKTKGARLYLIVLETDW